jgi:hypothetical protein
VSLTKLEVLGDRDRLERMEGEREEERADVLLNVDSSQ